MKYYSTQTVSAGAWLARNKSRLKIYDNSKVYLNDNDEFEIELYNPFSERIMAQITLNGSSENMQIVLNPGQRVFLERFLSEKKKFKFSTYNVEDTKEAKSAIANNGKVSIVFYKENFGWINSPGITWINGSSDNFRLYNSGGNSADLSRPTFTTSSYVNFSSDFSNKIETGRVEKGNYSSQEFSSTDGNFNTYLSQFNYQILPISTKVVEASEIRHYCTECGTRVRNSNWKYCPKCGNKLD